MAQRKLFDQENFNASEGFGKVNTGNREPVSCVIKRNANGFKEMQVKTLNL